MNDKRRDPFTPAKTDPDPLDALDARPWEPQEGETAKAFDAFRHYRDCDPSVRSVRRAFITVHGDDAVTSHRLARWRDWCARWGWVERARQWDAEVDRMRRDATRSAIETMKDDHVAAARSLLAIATESMRRERELMDDNPEHRIPPNLLATMMREAAALERLSHGMPGAIDRIEGDGDHVVEIKWTDDEPPGGWDAADEIEPEDRGDDER